MKNIHQCILYFQLLLIYILNTNNKLTKKKNCDQVGMTHLAFADDIMLFARGDPMSVNILMD